jgi:membrane protein
MKGRKNKHAVAVYIKILTDAFSELSKNDPLRMAGATAFFTTFALPPILIILIQSLGLFFSTEKAQQQLIYRLSTYVGNEAIRQIDITLRSITQLAQNNYLIVFGFLFLLFVATTLFKIIKGSLNQVWKIKVVHRGKVAETVADRLKAILVILVAGLLFVFAVIVEGLQLFVGRYIFAFSALSSFYFNAVINFLFSIFTVTLWFAVVFRFIPDARATGRVILIGALLTSVLFTIGKAVLRILLSHSNINNLYGTSASVVLLMLFVFYTSLILYYGAAFTKVWSVHKGQPIEPLHYASHYQLITDEADVSGNEG